MNNLKKIFWSNNYVLIKDAFKPYEGKFITKRANSIIESKNKDYIKYYDDGNKMYNVENFMNYNHGLKYFVKHRAEPIAREIYGNKISLYKDKLNFKYPGGGVFGEGSDSPRWKDFNSKFFLTVCLFADKSTVTNGCLQVSSGKHLERSFDQNFFPDKSFNWDWVEAGPQDMLIFNSFIPYRSFINNSKNNRRIFYLTYNDEKDGEFYQAHLNRELDIENYIMA